MVNCSKYEKSNLPSGGWCDNGDKKRDCVGCCVDCTEFHECRKDYKCLAPDGMNGGASCGD